MKKLLIFLFLPALLFSQSNLTQIQLDAWENFNAAYNNQWNIKWNLKYGSPSAIYGYETETLAGNKFDAAVNFLTSNKSIFGINSVPNELELKNIEQIGELSRVVFRQLYQNVPVYDFDIVIIFNSYNQIVSIFSHYLNDVNLNVNAIISGEEAIDISRNELSLFENMGTTETELVIYPFVDVPVLAWKVIINIDALNVYECIVDAHNGEVIDSYSLVMTSGGSTGLANIYPIDPVNSPLFEDQTLYRLIDNGYLDGQNVTVTTSLGSRAFNNNNDFRFSPDNDHFNEANVYHHIDKYAYDYWLVELNYELTKITANITEGTAASYNKINHIIVLGIGDTINLEVLPHNRGAGRKDDVMYHEYNHAIVHEVGLDNITDETRSLHEGYADYFAASFTNDHVIGEWFAYEAPHLRIVNNDNSYFNYKNWGEIDYNNIYNAASHLNGMIWSGACWDLRNSVGQSIADEIIFIGLQNAYNVTDFEEAMSSIIATDIQRYDGDHVDIIENIFRARGVIEPSAPVNFSLSGSPGENPTLSWDPNNEPDLNGYNLYWSIDNGPFNLLFSFDEYTTSFTDQGVIIGNNKNDPVVCYVLTSTDTHMNESDFSIPRCTRADGFNKDNTNEKTSESFDFELSDAFPNPFNPNTTISFSIPERSNVNLTVFDIMGQIVKVVEDKILGEGKYSYSFYAYDTGKLVTSGVYIYRLSSTGLESGKTFTKSKKLMLIK